MIEQRYGSVQANEVPLMSYQYVRFTIIMAVNIASCYRHADSRHDNIIDPPLFSLDSLDNYYSVAAVMMIE